MFNFVKNAIALSAFAGLTAAGFSPAIAGEKLTNDLSRCDGNSSSVLVDIKGVKNSTGKLRVQLYRGIKSEWMVSGKWLNRIEVPARAGNVKVCMPTPGAGIYAIAIRHDANGNGETDITQDGGGMSNNPSINIFNLGKPSYTKTRFKVGSKGVTIPIVMKYM